jgi:(2Fe-2S) ferredoxin
VKTLQELEEIKKRALEAAKLRESNANSKIVVGMGTCGIAAGARDTLAAIMDEIANRHLSDVVVTQTVCIGLCAQELIVEVTRQGQPTVTYGRVDANKARQIVSRHLVNGVIVGEWAISSK